MSKESIRDYAAQYYHHVRAFPRYLSATHSQVESLKARQVLLENLNDEEHGEENHPELWLRFAEGLGADRDVVHAGHPAAGVQAVIDCFFRLSRSSAAEGLGALFAYESQVPEIARFKLAALKRFYLDPTDARALKFFEVHEKADVYHTQALREVLESLPEADQRLAEKAADEAAQALWGFLDSMQTAQAA